MSATVHWHNPIHIKNWIFNQNSILIQVVEHNSKESPYAAYGNKTEIYSTQFIITKSTEWNLIQLNSVHINPNKVELNWTQHFIKMKTTQFTQLKVNYNLSQINYPN